MRKIKFQKDRYYHVYNRGVDKRSIFNDKCDYWHFLALVKAVNQNKSIFSLEHFLRNPEPPSGPRGGHLVAPDPMVDIICYNLIPNHYHFTLKQLAENGISRFMHKLGNGHAHYYNLKYLRSGSLFQGPYKAVLVDSDEYLAYLSCYINGNAEIHKIAKADKWPWSSYHEYLNLCKSEFLKKDIILKQFKSVNEYRKYTEQIIKESSVRKEELKKYLLEPPGGSS